MGAVQVDGPAPGAVTAGASARVGSETAERQRSAVSLSVSAYALVAAACFAWATYGGSASLSWALLAFVLLAALADLREVRLPGVGVVGMSFVPAMAALITLGLWPAMVVSVVSGATSAGFTRDPLKVIFNVSNALVSTFVAGLVFLGLVPTGAGLAAMIIPAFVATAVDFFVNTGALAVVVSLSSHRSSMAIWRENYQWALPGYLAGATFALAAAWLYNMLAVAGLVLAIPPVVLIYYSYETYVARVRERRSFDAERDSFQAELVASAKIHDELRAAQEKVAAEIERAHRIQVDLLPSSPPHAPGLELEHRIHFLAEVGGDYYDYITFPDGRVGMVCGDVMGKGLAAALVMAMARSLLHNAVSSDKRAGAILNDVNAGLTRDLEGQRLPCFLTLALAVYDPRTGSITVASGGHTPLLIARSDGVHQIPAQSAALGVRDGLTFAEDEVDLAPGDVIALYTDGLTEARSANGELYGPERLAAALAKRRPLPPAQILSDIWADIDAFRAGAPPSDDATLLLGRAL